MLILIMINLRLTDKKISVLITVYNNEKYIGKCIESLKNQTYKNWEAIIVDDGSTDDTPKILKKECRDKRFRVITFNKNKGRVAAYNYAFLKCKGHYIAVLDSDDIASKNRFKEQINFLNKNKTAKIVASWAYLIDRNSKKIRKMTGPIDKEKIKDKLMLFNFIPHSTLIYCRDYAKKFKILPLNYKYAIDNELYLKFLRRTDIFVIPKFLGKIRYLTNSITHSKNNKLTVINDDLKSLKYVNKYFNLSISKKFFLLFKKLQLKLKLTLYKYKFV